uniref:BILBO1 N-terminal domain-containing protein n=1 Tax=Angomonas deanei TaxID=59799 RepID=C6K3P6_9TRYP|nr:hypothetical protein CDFL6B12_08 [Angomonas deanei]
MFTILCCADLHGEKVNLEVTLDAAPVSVQELVAYLTHIFAREEQAMLSHLGHPTAVPPFQIASAFIYDDVLLRWTKLKSVSQLHEYDQLYVFQPQTPSHRDSQQDLPPPRPPVQSRATSITGATPLAAAAHRGGVPAYASAHSIDAPAAVAQPPSVQLRGDAGARRTPGVQGASTLSDGPRVASRSPVRAQLEEQRREEERLSQRLSSVRSERERLEREAQRAEEEERRRRAAELDDLLRRQEQEIWSHRDALAKAEEEYQRLLAEKQQLMGSLSSH